MACLTYARLQPPVTPIDVRSADSCSTWHACIARRSSRFGALHGSRSIACAANVARTRQPAKQAHASMLSDGTEHAPYGALQSDDMHSQVRLSLQPCGTGMQA